MWSPSLAPVERLIVTNLGATMGSAPSLRQISDLGIDEEALRPDPDSAWATGPLPR